MNFFEKNDVGIIIISLLALFGLLLWRSSSSLDEFGLNFFTEMLGVVLTVVVLDRSNKIREERRNMPLRIAAYNDISLLVTRFFYVWTRLYGSGTKSNNFPSDYNSFFADKYFEKIWNEVDLLSKPATVENQPGHSNWIDFIEERFYNLSDKGQKILERYYHVIPKDVYRNVHLFSESNMMRRLKAINRFYLDIGSSNNLEKLYLSQFLSLTLYIRKDHSRFDALLELHEWCNKEYGLLTKKSIEDKFLRRIPPLVELYKKEEEIED